MKKYFSLIALASVVLVSCTGTRNATSSIDDVYFDPKKDRVIKKETDVAQYENTPADPNAGKIGVSEADRNNPYYQDPNLGYDDYYDNTYASRINRFQRPVYGLGYYDSYYTNSYYYTGNPAMYGVSIYSGYNFWNPGYSGWNYGIGMGYGYGYSPYNSFWGAYNSPYYGMGGGWNNPWMNPYGYGGYNPWCNNYYGYGGGYGWGNPYWSGYNSGFYNGLYAGYYNSFDANSNTYNGPRGVRSGGNSGGGVLSPTPNKREAAPGIQVNENTPASAMSDNAVRFNHVPIPAENMIKIKEESGAVKGNMNNGYGQPHITPNPGYMPNEGLNNPGYTPGRNNVPVYTNPGKPNSNPGYVPTQNETVPKKNNSWNNDPNQGKPNYNNDPNQGRPKMNSNFDSPRSTSPSFENKSFGGSGGGRSGGGGGISRPR